MSRSPAEIQAELDVLCPKPDHPCPPAPEYHVEDTGQYRHCDYGWQSAGPDDKGYWLECNCEDPANPWPPRAPTDGPKECQCYHCWVKPRVDRGRAPCENENHHCPMCHERGCCTSSACNQSQET